MTCSAYPGLPQPEEAGEIQKHMRKVGFSRPDIGGVVEKSRNKELERHRGRTTHIAHIEEELGDVFAVVNPWPVIPSQSFGCFAPQNKKIRQRFNRRAALARQEQSPWMPSMPTDSMDYGTASKLKSEEHS